MFEIFQGEGEKNSINKITNSGDRACAAQNAGLTIPGNCTVRHSFIKKSTISIIILPKPEFLIAPGNIYTAVPGTIISQENAVSLILVCCESF